MEPLFRQAAIDERRTPFLGEISLARKPAFAALTAMACILCALLILFAIFGKATKKVSMSGLLLPEDGLIHVFAQNVGTVTDLAVREGSEVRKGQVLAILRLGSDSSRGDTYKLVANAIEERRLALDTERSNAIAQAKQKELALREKLRSLRLDIVQAEAELLAVEQRTKLQQLSLDRDIDLRAKGYISEAQLQSRREEGLDLQVRLHSVQRNLEGLRRDARALEDESQSNRLLESSTLSQLDRAKSSLDQEKTENSARADWIVRAPIDGTVGLVSVHEGQILQLGQTLVSLIPKSASKTRMPNDDVSKFEVQLYGASQNIGFVKAGQPVWLRLHAFPYQKYGMLQATINEVSRTPVKSQDVPEGVIKPLPSSGAPNEPFYIIRARIDPLHIMYVDGEAISLKAGMTVDADVVQDRRAIWEWALEPLLAVHMRSHLSN
jgi:membrane fusion protein